MKGSRTYSKHGLTTLRTRITRQGRRGIDRRTRAGRALDEWQKSLEADLGGVAALSAQERALVEVAVRSKALLDHVDRWLLDQGDGVVNRRTRTLVPVMKERAALAEQLARVLGQLGLERRTAPAPSLREFMATRSAPAALQRTSAPPSTDQPPPTAIAPPGGRAREGDPT